jgi:hypothetical protein
MTMMTAFMVVVAGVFEAGFAVLLKPPRLGRAFRWPCTAAR